MKRKMKFLSLTLVPVLGLAATLTCTAATYTVTTTADLDASDEPAQGSLREAILFANATEGVDTIVFEIAPATGLTIVPATDLPAITEAVIIDGTMQPGIVIKAATDFNGTGLTLASGGSTVRGIAVTKFATGIVIADVPNNTLREVALHDSYTNLRIAGANAAGNIVVASEIGLGLGMNRIGIHLDHAGANTIGGPGADDGNVIGKNSNGILIIGGGGNLIQGNYIGVSRELVPIIVGTYNQHYADYYAIKRNGIGIRGQSTSGNTIQDNKICANSSYGVELEDCTGPNYIYRNNIGGWANQNVAGNIGNYRTFLSELSYGWYAGNGSQNFYGGGVILRGCSGQVIGGPGMGNVFAHNHTGILVQDSTAGRQSQNNTIQGNDVMTSRNSHGETVELALVGASGTLVGGTGNGEFNFFLSLAGNASVLVISSPEAERWSSQYTASHNKIVGNRILSGRPAQTINGVAVPKGAAVLAMGKVESTSVLANLMHTGSSLIDLGGVVGVSGNLDDGSGTYYIPLHGDGPTPNDPHDGDTGPNRLQNYPVIELAWHKESTLGVKGTLDSDRPLSRFHLEFYKQSQFWMEFIGSCEVQTDENGDATFIASIPVSSHPGEIFATATDSDGNTSEISPAGVGVLWNERAPVANAGADQTVTVPHDGNPATTTAPVQLDGSGSSDPDGDALTYLWQAGGTVLGTDPIITVNLVPGTHVITLTVANIHGIPAFAQATVTVQPEPNLPPAADAGPDQSIFATGSLTPVTLDAYDSLDPDGDTLSYAWTEKGTQIGTGVSPTVNLAPGRHKITLAVADAYGASATAEVAVDVVYSWSGVLQPIVSGAAFKTGNPVAVKFALTGPSAGITTLAATLSYAQVIKGKAGRDVPAVSANTANSGNLFRYDSTARQYTFNWSTKGLTAGTYRLFIRLGDGVVHTVDIELK